MIYEPQQQMIACIQQILWQKRYLVLFKSIIICMWN